MEVARAGAQFHLINSRHGRVAGHLSAPGAVTAELGAVGKRFAAPCTRNHIPGLVAFAQEVERHHRELESCPTLDEEDLEFIRSTREAAHQGFGLVVDLLIVAAAVAHLHNRHARVVILGKLVADFFQDLQR